MIELNDQQKKEDFNGRLKQFQVDLQGLQENYKLAIEATLFTSPRGIVPTLSIIDTKYAPSQSQKSPPVISSEPPPSNQEGVATPKEPLSGNSEDGKK